MKEYRKIFVICRKDGDIEHSDNYCKHGPIGEMEDAIGYGTLLDARKFLIAATPRRTSTGSSPHGPGRCIIRWKSFRGICSLRRRR